MNLTAARRPARLSRLIATLLFAIIAAALMLFASSDRAFAVGPANYPPTTTCTDCSGIDNAVTTTPSSGGLAMTGAPAIATGIAGVIVLGLGVTLLVVSRRGRPDNSV